MKKILVAIDPLDFNPATIGFAIHVSSISRSKLIGVFLDDLPDDQSYDVSMAAMPYGAPISRVPNKKAYERNQNIANSIQKFEKLCEDRGARYGIHKDSGIAFQELIKESRYADMIILDPAMSFETFSASVPTRFTKKILAEAECPIIIASYTYAEIEETILTFDGSDSSVFAIKQFTYLFPELLEKPVLVLEIPDTHQLSKPDRQQLEEFLHLHYSSIRFQSLTGDEENELFKILVNKTNSIVVMGAQGRNIFSKFFRHSTAEIMLRTADTPFFISHR